MRASWLTGPGLYWTMARASVRMTRLRLGVCAVVFSAVSFLIIFKAEVNTWSRQPAKDIDYSQDENDDNKEDNNGSGLFYTSPNYPGLRGRPFAVSNSLLSELQLFSQKFTPLTKKTLQQFVFATAASFAFFDMLKEAVTSVQRHRPQNQIYVYDLGLTQMQVHEVQSMCGVIYRKFGFSIFPKHVKKKFTYAWKPLVIADVLTRHPGVFWIDTSVRLTSGNFSALLRQVKEAGGGLALTTTGHSTYAVTHPAMLRYLPAGSPAALRREEQREATLLLYRTADMMTQVVKWLVLCALDPGCIAPARARRGCVWKGRDHFGVYGKCHRYDQSAFNILMMNYIHGKSSWGYYAYSKVCRVQRYVSGNTMPKYCAGDKSKDDLEL